METTSKFRRPKRYCHDHLTITYPSKKCPSQEEACRQRNIVKGVLAYEDSSQNNIHLSSLWESEKYHRTNVGFLEVECAKHCKTIVTAPHICYDHEKRSKQCGSIMNLWTVESSVDVYVCASQKLHCLMIPAFLDPAKVPFRRPSAGFEAWVRVILSHLNAWWVTRFSRSEGAGYSSEVYAMWVIGSHQNYTDYLTYLTFVPCTAFICIYINI